MGKMKDEEAKLSATVAMADAEGRAAADEDGDERWRRQ